MQSHVADLCRHQSGLIAHPSRCEAFLECATDGHVIERVCGPTLHFNADKQVCDYVHLANCQLNNNGTRNFISNAEK